MTETKAVNNLSFSQIKKAIAGDLTTGKRKRVGKLAPDRVLAPDGVWEITYSVSANPPSGVSHYGAENLRNLEQTTDSQGNLLPAEMLAFQQRVKAVLEGVPEGIEGIIEEEQRLHKVRYVPALPGKPANVNIVVGEGKEGTEFAGIAGYYHIQREGVGYAVLNAKGLLNHSELALKHALRHEVNHILGLSHPTEEPDLTKATQHNVNGGGKNNNALNLTHSDHTHDRAGRPIRRGINDGYLDGYEGGTSQTYKGSRHSSMSVWDDQLLAQPPKAYLASNGRRYIDPNDQLGYGRRHDGKNSTITAEFIQRARYSVIHADPDKKPITLDLRSANASGLHAVGNKPLFVNMHVEAGSRDPVIDGELAPKHITGDKPDDYKKGVAWIHLQRAFDSAPVKNVLADKTRIPLDVTTREGSNVQAGDSNDAIYLNGGNVAVTSGKGQDHFIIAQTTYANNVIRDFESGDRLNVKSEDFKRIELRSRKDFRYNDKTWEGTEVVLFEKVGDKKPASSVFVLNASPEQVEKAIGNYVGKNSQDEHNYGAGESLKFQGKIEIKEPPPALSAPHPNPPISVIPAIIPSDASIAPGEKPTVNNVPPVAKPSLEQKWAKYRKIVTNNIARLTRWADVNNDGTLSAEEAKALNNSTQAGKWLQEEASKLIKSFDTDGHGISMKELAAAADIIRNDETMSSILNLHGKPIDAKTVGSKLAVYAKKYDVNIAVAQVPEDTNHAPLGSAVSPKPAQQGATK